MWENPLSLWIKETVCIMYTEGEGGTRKGERLRGRTVSRKIYEVGKYFRKLIDSFWIEAVIHKYLFGKFGVFLAKTNPLNCKCYCLLLSLLFLSFFYTQDYSLSKDTLVSTDMKED